MLGERSAHQRKYSLNNSSPVKRGAAVQRKTSLNSGGGGEKPSIREQKLAINSDLVKSGSLRGGSSKAGRKKVMNLLLKVFKSCSAIICYVNQIYL